MFLGLTTRSQNTMEKDRKYFYAVYDFPIEEVGSKLKIEKKVLIKIHFGPQKLV